MPREPEAERPPIPALALDHVAHAVPDLEAACRFYRETYGCPVTDPVDVPEQGIRIAYAILGNARIELITPIAPGSPVSAFLERAPAGGLHHLCLTVADTAAAAKGAVARGLRILGSREPRPGHHGRPLFFLHPKDCCGALTEIEAHPEDERT